MATIIKNLVRNPSAEVNLTGISVAGGSQTTSRVTGVAGVVAGTYAVQTAADGTLNGRGHLYLTDTGLATVGLTYRGAVSMMTSPAGIPIALYLRATYTDATAVNGTFVTHTSTGAPVRVACSFTTDPAKTLDSLSLWVIVSITPPIGAFELRTDAAMIVEGAELPDYFDGDSGADYAWLGPAHASASTFTVPPNGYLDVLPVPGTNPDAPVIVFP